MGSVRSAGRVAAIIIAWEKCTSPQQRVSLQLYHCPSHCLDNALDSETMYPLEMISRTVMGIANDLIVDQRDTHGHSCQL